MNLIKRKQELSLLETRYASNTFELCVMYGRRRVGKTTLIAEFIKGKKAVFFSALISSAAENLAFLSTAINQTLQPQIAGAHYPSFQAALEQVFASAAKERLVFVIDEYPYLLQSYGTIASLLQHLIDRNKHKSKLFMILCGSAMTQMEEEFFANNRPLYGRKTFQIKVKPFGFFDLLGHFSKTKPTDLSYLYGAYGGIPRYFENYDQSKSFKDNIFRDFLTRGAPLIDEPESVLSRDVREPASYNTVLSAIASGSTKYSKISSKAQLASGNVTRYLDTLAALDLIKRELPAYTGEKKRTLYRIEDNLFRFWYRFIPPNLSLINSGKAQIAYQSIENGLDQYLGSIFESICQEYLWRINGNALLPFTFVESGRWWGGDVATQKQAEIDILAWSGDESALFCECKWTNAKVGEDILLALEQKSRLNPFARIKTKHLCVFSKTGFTKSCKTTAHELGAQLISLADMVRG